MDDARVTRTSFGGPRCFSSAPKSLAPLCMFFLSALPLSAYNTLGVNVTPYGSNQPFNQSKITEMRWKAASAEFVTPDHSADFGKLRIEFNFACLRGPLGSVNCLGLMLQNLVHQYQEASCMWIPCPEVLSSIFRTSTI
ncbi:MAG TPA: hypothetical protein VGS57_10455 [Thermoanaerobaculia bacterium]|jgi:hypothetical protein|nr:hypothetical protein [Thermoanaerobaculia bacterium]